MTWCTETDTESVITERLMPPVLAPLLLVPVLLLPLGPRPASAQPEACVGHSDCEAGEFCSVLNSTRNASGLACIGCAVQLCAMPSDTSAGCRLPCTAVDGDCCSAAFRTTCASRNVFYAGPTVPCSMCDSAVVTVHARGDSVDATLSPSAQMLRESFIGTRIERFPCASFDTTLVGSVGLRCVQASGGATLQASAENCSRRVYEATQGFSYHQDPSWSPEASNPETTCGGISLVSGFNPLLDVGVSGVGRCQTADTWPMWGRAAFVGPDWVDGEHERWGSWCVDCAVETGYEGGRATLRLYRGSGCSPLRLARSTELTIDQCTLDTGRQARYSAACDVRSSSCPRPDQALQVSVHRSNDQQRAALCASEPEFLVVVPSMYVGMEHCVKISRNNTFRTSAYASFQICCTPATVRIRYFSDLNCQVSDLKFCPVVFG